MRRTLALAVTASLAATALSLPAQDATTADRIRAAYPSASPLTRWWWFAGEIATADVDHQLRWLAANGFGGVEIAWIYPNGRSPDARRFEWLGEDWQRVVSFTKRRADELGLACDFTFGTLWPFGGTFVADADRTRVFGDADFRQRLRLSWTHPVIGDVVDHLDQAAFRRYAEVMGDALRPAMAGSTSALFVDSWEVHTRDIWTDGFGAAFEARHGYNLRPFMADILAAEHAGPRYDYMRLVADYVEREFYRPFTAVSHELGGLSRGQCAGSPTDLLASYAALDVPETEAMLYEPGFGRIPSSAAALSGRPLVSAESFTCVYGFPGVHLGEERVADLRLVADALFAHGVNLIVWHGMPFNGVDSSANRFYATVHVGEDGALSEHLPGFNAYLARRSAALRRGRTYSDVAVYLPLEDAWIAGEYPAELQQKWSWGQYELRYVRPAAELAGRHPLWISLPFLERARYQDGRLQCDATSFSSLYVDVQYLDAAALRRILELARAGLPVCLKQRPAQPGHRPFPGYANWLDELLALPNVQTTFETLDLSPPLLHSDAPLPPYWARIDGADLLLFLAHPASADLHLPLELGQADRARAESLALTVHHAGRDHALSLRFPAGRSLLLRIPAAGPAQVIE